MVILCTAISEFLDFTHSFPVAGYDLRNKINFSDCMTVLNTVYFCISLVHHLIYTIQCLDWVIYSNLQFKQETFSTRQIKTNLVHRLLYSVCFPFADQLNCVCFQPAEKKRKWFLLPHMVVLKPSSQCKPGCNHVLVCSTVQSLVLFIWLWGCLVDTGGGGWQRVSSFTLCVLPLVSTGNLSSQIPASMKDREKKSFPTLLSLWFDSL